VGVAWVGELTEIPDTRTETRWPDYTPEVEAYLLTSVSEALLSETEVGKSLDTRREWRIYSRTAK